MEQLLQFVEQHKTLVGGVSAWVALSLVVNLLLLMKGPQGWVDMAKKSPKVALVINVLFRAFGVDLVSVIIHFRDYVNAKAGETPATQTPAAPAATEAVEEKKS